MTDRSIPTEFERAQARRGVQRIIALLPQLDEDSIVRLSRIVHAFVVGSDEEVDRLKSLAEGATIDFDALDLCARAVLDAYPESA